MRFWTITNKPEFAELLTKNGVERIFIDLERLGKKNRQKGGNFWISDHIYEDISRIKKVIPKNSLLTRLNPWNSDSKEEIDLAIKYGADYLMLPMINDIDEVKRFSEYIKGRAKFIPLIETKNSFRILEKIIKFDGISEVYIGLNDLKLSMGYKFLFEPIINGMLEDAARILNNKKMEWGFGGLARIGEGIISPEYILSEHVRLKSQNVILSRSFYENININERKDIGKEILKIKDLVKFYQQNSNELLEKNHEIIKLKIKKIVNN